MDGSSSDSSMNVEQEMNNYKRQVQENFLSNYVMQNSNANSFETYDNCLPCSTAGDKKRKKDSGDLNRSKKQKTAARRTRNKGRGKRDTKPQRRLAQVSSSSDSAQTCFCNFQSNCSRFDCSTNIPEEVLSSIIPREEQLIQAQEQQLLADIIEENDSQNEPQATLPLISEDKCKWVQRFIESMSADRIDYKKQPQQTNFVKAVEQKRPSIVNPNVDTGITLTDGKTIVERVDFKKQENGDATNSTAISNFPAATSTPRHGTNQFVNDNDISYIPGPSNEMQNLDDLVTDISHLDRSNVTLRTPKYKSTSFANEPNSRSGKDDIMSIVNNIVADDTEKINEEVNQRCERWLLSNRSLHEVVDSVIVIGDSSLQQDALPINNDTHITLSSDDSVSFVDLVSCDVPSTKKSNLVEPAPKPVTEVSQNQSKTNIDHSNIKEQVDKDPEENSQSTKGFGFCSICLESLANTSVSSTTCGHIFCTSCIKAAVKSHRKCPICRTQLTLKKIHPLFF